MKTDMMKLLNAQEIDLEIDRLGKSKKKYPEQIEMLKKEITDLKESIDDIEVRIHENQKNRRLIEEELTAERDTLLKKEKRLLETKTNKEYTAVQHEIEMSRMRIDNLETEDLQLMTESDQLLPQRDELREKYEATRKTNNSLLEELQDKYNSHESDIAKLERKRDEILTNVNNRGLVVYKRLRKGKSGLAVAKVDHNKLSCMGCFKQLPPQKALEVRRADKLMFCENCGRILVWDSREETS